VTEPVEVRWLSSSKSGDWACRSPVAELSEAQWRENYLLPKKFLKTNITIFLNSVTHLSVTIISFSCTKTVSSPSIPRAQHPEHRHSLRTKFSKDLLASFRKFISRSKQSISIKQTTPNSQRTLRCDSKAEVTIKNFPPWWLSTDRRSANVVHEVRWLNFPKPIYQNHW